MTDVAKTIECSRVDEAAIAYESQNAVLVQPVAGPTEEPSVHVVELGLLRIAGIDVGFFDPLVDVGILTVLVVLVFVELVRVVWWIANNDTDFRFWRVCVRHCLRSLLQTCRPDGRCTCASRNVVEGVDETKVREILILTGDRRVGGLDVQVSHVVGKDGNFVGVQLVRYLCVNLAVVRGSVPELADECAGADGRIEDLNVVVDEIAEKCFSHSQSALQS